MNRRRTTLLLCCLIPLFLLSCQTYTASQGKAAIQPIASVAEGKTITKYSVLQEEQEALLKEKALQEEQERAALVAQQQAERESRLAFLTEREKELEASLEALNSRLGMAQEENLQLVDTLTELSLEKEEILLSAQASEQESALLIEQLKQERTEILEELTLESTELMELLNQENAGRIEELQAQNAQLASKIVEQQRVIDETQQNLDSLTELSLEKEQIIRSAQLSLEQSAQQIEELQQQNAQLASELGELQSLLEEYTILQQGQKEELLRLQQEQEQLLSEQEQAHLLAWQQLSDERDALAGEMRMLKAQLEEKTLTIEEKVRLEQLRKDEAKRVEQERLEKRRQQEEMQMRIASEEEAKRLALEKEWRQIPALDQITYPRLYKTEKPTSLAKDGEKLRVLMLPLDDVPWKESNIVLEVHSSIRDLDIPIIFVTGHMENVVALVKEMRSNAALFSTGAIITSFPIQELSTYGAEIQYQEKKKMRLIVANLPEYQVVQEFSRGAPWQATQKKLTENRLSQLKGMVGEGSLTVATLLGASLYEPSYRDWNTFSPIAYRQTDYLWPLSAFLENEGFYDTYRLTHFSEATNAGNTLGTPTWSERVDFIYSRKILPLDSALLTIGGESAPDERGVSRFGVLGTFLVP